jgi:hypothetical protein
MQSRQRPGRERRVDGRFAGEVSHFEIGGDKRIYQHLLALERGESIAERETVRSLGRSSRFRLTLRAG